MRINFEIVIKVGAHLIVQAFSYDTTLFDCLCNILTINDIELCSSINDIELSSELCSVFSI